MIIGNKCDLEAERVVQPDAAQKLAAGFGQDVEHIETSAKDNTNVHTAFIQLAQKALKRRQEM